MSDPIILTITDTARREMLNYEKSGLEVLFSHVSLGAGNYQHSKDTAAMAMPWADFPILNSFLDEGNHCLVLTVLGRVDLEKTVTEIALYDMSGGLFAIAAKPEGYYFKTQSGVYFTFAVSIALDQKIDGQKIKLAFSHQQQLLQALITLHTQHNNPHPQYIKFMAGVITAHLADADPHPQYATKIEADKAVEQYLKTVDSLLSLYVSLLSYNCFAGSLIAGSSNLIELNGYSGSLLNSTPLLINPEGAHEAWSISREAKKFTASIFNRSGTSRTTYAGNLSWVVLPLASDSVVVGKVMPELIDSGVLNSTGSLEVKRAANSEIDYSGCVFLMCPEGAHEGWSIGREQGKFSASIYNRSGTTRIGYSGKVSYAVFKKKAGALPLVYPGLLMSGVASGANFSIERPDGMSLDFTDPKFVLLITPEGAHEAWTVTREVDRISVNVFHRSGTDRIGYSGNVNWAIIMKEG